MVKFKIQGINKIRMYIGVRLVGNLIIYLAATWNWPEFTGLRGRRFPGQEEPRTPDIQPRRIKLPPTFASEWRNIGSRIKSFQDLGMPRYGPQKKFPPKPKSKFSFFEQGSVSSGRQRMRSSSFSTTCTSLESFTSEERRNSSAGSKRRKYRETSRMYRDAED